MNKIYNRLVATGDPDADAALRLSSTIASLSRSLAKANERVKAGEANAAVIWPPASTDLNTVGYRRAYQVAAVGPHVIEAIREEAESLALAAHARNEWIRDRVMTQMNRETDPTFTPEEIRLYTVRDA
ncbi:hypothetical protein [Nonomuraea angiospora]|uniref:hypothetical protein n=1 Tax=Nonomuraea angiospora TaxID=46172 RepID=UPI0029BD38AC|nr:hypothetical protein [Nonomuraea angiospora]MDX3100477.1 hypothetical protein [Nonomuraea angiospora]